MKRFLTICITIFVSIVLVFNILAENKVAAANKENIDNQEAIVEDIASKIIRFHVIANSDTDEDQNLKLKVRDAVLEYIRPLLENSNDIQESRMILKREDSKLIDIAKKVIKENGYDYSVESTLTKEYFPVKTYGNITLPQGKYEAYRIIIGTGEGHNWWCVMFPPICFVDITKGDVAYEKTENEMSRVLDKNEMELVDNRAGTENTKEDDKQDDKHDEEYKHDEKDECDEEKNKDEACKKNDKVIDNTEENNICVKFKIADLFKNLFN